MTTQEMKDRLQALDKTVKEIIQEAKKTTKTKIAIYVSGGAVQEVLSNKDDIEVILFDVDNMEAEGISGDKIDKKWDKIQEECHHAL